MLRIAVWTTRVTGLAVVGVLTFLGPPSTPAGLPIQIVAYTLICVGVAAWGLIDLPRRPPGWAARYALPVTLGVLTVAAGLGAAVGGGGDSLVAFAIVAVMTVADQTPLAVALAVAALGVLAVEIGAIVADEGVGTLVGFPLLMVLGLLVGRNRAAYRHQAEQAAALLAQHEELRSEQRRADVLDERTRIAREIHDVLAHSLGALGIQIQAARALLTDRGDVERALETLATAQRMASEGLAETRRAVHALRTDTLPLHEELARAAAEHAERYRVAAHCETGGSPRPVPPDATVALLRTAQEALVNAAKHAPGKTIDLRLDYHERGLVLTLANDLADAGPATADTPAMHTVDGGYGLTGMRERLLLLRGTLEAGPRGNQWVVTADLPLSPQRQP